MESKFNKIAARGAENYRQQIAANNKTGVEGGYRRARKHKYLYYLMLWELVFTYPCALEFIITSS